MAKDDTEEERLEEYQALRGGHVWPAFPVPGTIGAKEDYSPTVYKALTPRIQEGIEVSDKPSALETFLGILLPGSVGHVMEAMGHSGEDWGSESKRKPEPVSSNELKVIGSSFRTEARSRVRGILKGGGSIGWVDYVAAYNELVDQKEGEYNKLHKEYITLHQEVVALRQQSELMSGALMKARDMLKEQDNVISALSTRHISGSKGN